LIEELQEHDGMSLVEDYVDYVVRQVRHLFRVKAKTILKTNNLQIEIIPHRFVR